MIFETKLDEEPSKTKGSPPLKKRKSTRNREKSEWKIRDVSQSHSESDGSMEEYAPPAPKSQNTKSLRGILAYEAAVRKRSGRISHEATKITGKKKILVGVSKRGRVSGRGRVRVRGISRGRYRRRDFIDRTQMLEEHRRIVGEICEDNSTESESHPDHKPILPTLSDGNCKNGFHLLFSIIIYKYTNADVKFTADLIARIIELKEKINSGSYSHRPKSNARKSVVWSIFNEIVDEDGAIINNFFHCTDCQAINQSIKGTTTQLLRHPCVRKLMPSASGDRVKIDQIDFDNLKTATAKYVCLGLHSFYSVECPGFQDVIMAGVKLGQKYPDITRDDLLSCLPGRKAIKNAVIREAMESKEHIKCLFKKSIRSGGMGCTLDLWTDKYKHNTYMAMTAHFCTVEDTSIEQNRIVFYMGNIADIVKSKAVIKSKIVEVFADFGLTEAEIKNLVVFTTDR